MSPSTPMPRAMLVDDEQAWQLAVAATLRAEGYEVLTATRVSEALAQPRPDVLVCETSLPDGTGFQLLSAMHERGEAPHAVFLSAQPALHECREAMRWGALDYLGKPFRLEELLDALQRGQPSASGDADSRRELTLRSRATPEAGDELITDLLAFLVGRNVAPSTRARVASAVGELLENVVEHAYTSTMPGPIELIARLDGDFLDVEIRDRGVGIGIVGTVLGPMFAAQNHGLQRATSLSESLDIGPREGGGTRAHVRFRVCATTFDEDLALDLSELDYLPPELARQVLEALDCDENPPLYNLSPALAVVIGRLLSNTSAGPSSQPAAWG